MACVSDPGYISYVIDTMKREFNLLGICIDNVNIRQDHNHMSVDSSSSYHAMHQYMGTNVIVELEFTCCEDEFEQLRPFAQQVEIRQERIYQPVVINTHAGYGSTNNKIPHFTYEIETRFMCVVRLNITGGSMDECIDSFRAGTEKLRYTIESKKFDKEVDKMLYEEDEYNV